ncbi:MAG: hypothetical protein ACPL1A_09990 [Candidatus Kapaibacteriota bacterium]
MKSKIILVVAILFVSLALQSIDCYAETKEPTITPIGDGWVWTLWNGPKHQIDNNQFTCNGNPNNECMEIMYLNKGSVNIGITGVLPAGTRVNLWNNWDSVPSGFTNVVLTNSWDVNSGVDPSYTTDQYSNTINDYQQFLNTQIHLDN